MGKYKLKHVDFEELKGLTLIRAEKTNRTDYGKIYGLDIYDLYEEDALIFETSENEVFIMQHEQDCCEDVHIESIIGDLNDLLNTPILLAEEAITASEKCVEKEFGEYHTWTFYKLATIKGYVDIRWIGESNGYYSEEVDLFKLVKE